MTGIKSPSAVFLDRDGVINRLVLDPASGTHESPYRPQDVHLKEGAVEAVKLLRSAGFILIVVSNQPAAAKGSVTMSQLEAVHHEVVQKFSNAGLELDDYFYCHHHQAGSDPALTCSCDCRKPKPGMLLAAAKKWDLELSSCWMVGDSDTDIEAASSVGCKTVLLADPLSAHRRKGRVKPSFTVDSLFRAAESISNIPTDRQ